MSPTVHLLLTEAAPLPGSESIVSGLFLLFVLTTVGGALLAVVTTRIIRSVCGLALACLGLAGLFYFLHSPFLALMEILIYVGAVCVAIIFAIMLADPDEPPSEGGRIKTGLWTLASAIVAGAIFMGLARIGLLGDWPQLAIGTRDWSVQKIGVDLLTTYSLPFEAISLVLLVAIIGSLAVARIGRHRE